MSVLDDRLRTILERNIDTVMDDPKTSRKTFTLMLEACGIDPNLDAILSFIVGYVYGVANSWVANHQNRMINADELAAVIKLMKRRSWEMKQALISTYVDT